MKPGYGQHLASALKVDALLTPDTEKGHVWIIRRNPN
jgi:hypothetical protein